MERRRVYKNADGIRREMIWDDDGRVIFSMDQDVEEIVDGIARDRDNMRHGDNKIAARLPAFKVEELTRRGIYNDPDDFKKWLNSSDASDWRVWKGNL